MTEVKDLQTRFNEDIVPELKKTLGIKNKMALPKITKIIINCGVGHYVKSQKKDHSNIVENLAKISGQRPVAQKAKKAISNFKVREGEVVGVSVTIRGKKMYDFLNKLINVVFPRVRDFRGASPKSFDGKGNYSIGFREHIVFPEINPDDVTNLHGLQINITTNAKNNEEGFELLKAMGFPFQKPAPKVEKATT
jgi:large subunit ribosomal protein L5